jgi:hypothetical protein
MIQEIMYMFLGFTQPRQGRLAKIFGVSGYKTAPGTMGHETFLPYKLHRTKGSQEPGNRDFVTKEAFPKLHFFGKRPFKIQFHKALA